MCGGTEAFAVDFAVSGASSAITYDEQLVPA